MPKLTAMCEIVNPAAPASASWMTEIWPTKPGDHHQRQRHQRADQRIDQRLAEVEREHDQEHRADERADQPGADQVLRAGRLGQRPLDDLAATGNARPAPEQHDDDDEKRQQVR
jgi:hypothetical protein